MDKTEAQAILDKHLVRYSGRAYNELVPLVEARQVETLEVLVNSGTRYQIEIEFIWDDQPGGVIRILAAIDDGGIRALFPLSRSELVSPPERIRV